MGVTKQTEPSYEAKQYVALVNSLGEKVGFKYGWQSDVARQLGISPTYLTKVMKGEIRRVGAPFIYRAARAAGVPVESFYADGCAPLTTAAVAAHKTDDEHPYFAALAEFHTALDGVLCVDDPAAAAAQVAFIRERVRRLDAAREAWRASTVR